MDWASKGQEILLNLGKIRNKALAASKIDGDLRGNPARA
jgi:hypothetical protein